MHSVKHLITRAGAAPGTFLVTGETGTGKELVARAIHAASPRAGRPFVALNCAALSDSLLENELFGHARGAFTGAAAARAGLIEHAHRGTLPPDEVGTMPAGLQAKLLRALESGEVRRIGENEARTVDVRFVAATNTDLQAAVDAGTFRNDLFYRLNVHRIHVPPIRERPGDVERLIAYFLKRYGAPAGVTGCSAAARRRPRRSSPPTIPATSASCSTSSSARSRLRAVRSSSPTICPRRSSRRACRPTRPPRAASRRRATAPSAR